MTKLTYEAREKHLEKNPEQQKEWTRITKKQGKKFLNYSLKNLIQLRLKFAKQIIIIKILLDFIMTMVSKKHWKQSNLSYESLEP